MVASDKNRARQEFGRLLNDELDRTPAPKGRGRISWVHAALKHKGRELVSVQQVRKWIRGIDMPDQANLRILCERLGLSWVRLQPLVQAAGADPLFHELEKTWHGLPDLHSKREVLRYAKYVLGEAGKNPNSDLKPLATSPSRTF